MLLVNNISEGTMEIDLVFKVKLFILNYRMLYEEGRINYQLNKKSQDFLRDINMNVRLMSKFIYEHLQTEYYYSGP
jgi:hypothetical protein